MPLCFSARIIYVPVAEVRFSQIGHVDERHSARAVAENEQVAGQRQRRRVPQVESEKLQYDLFVDGLLVRAVDSGVDVLERVALFYEALFYGAVVNGPQDTHVKRYGVADQALPDQKPVVSVDDPFGQRCERQLRFFEVLGETVHGPFVVAGRPQSAGISQLHDPFLHEIHDRNVAGRRAVSVCYVVRRVGFPAVFQLSDNVFQFPEFAVDFSSCRGGAGVLADDTLRFFVPFFRMQADGGLYASDFPQMGYPIDDRSRPALDFR